MKQAVCLLSGGLDSCVTAYIAKRQGFELVTLNVNYGQRHIKEQQCAQRIVKALNVRRHLEFSVPLHQFGGSSLFYSAKQDIPDTLQGKDNEDIPSTYVAGRNIVFLSLALSLAEGIDADAVFIGVNAVDYSGYPDCRPEFIKAFQRVVEVGTKRGVSGRSISIEAPLLHLTKKEIISEGVRLNVPFDLTWSCYRGFEKACGRCDSCLLRLKGFHEAGVEDPLKYQETPSGYRK